MAAPLVKVFGERNTGTRALLQMLRGSNAVTIRMAGAGVAAEKHRQERMAAEISRHFSGHWRKLYRDALRDNHRHVTDPLLTWKHAAPEWHPAYTEQDVRVIFMVRNPYSWVLSMLKRPYHIAGPRPDSLETLVTRPWLTQRRDNTDILLPNVLALWQAKVCAYSRFAEQAQDGGVPTATLTFEDFVADPVACAGAALRDLGITARALRPVARSTKPPRQSLADIQAYYMQEKWRSRLTRNDVALINARMDWELAGKVGYRRLSPGDFPAQATHGTIHRRLPGLFSGLQRERGSAPTA